MDTGETRRDQICLTYIKLFRFVVIDQCDIDLTKLEFQGLYLS